MSKQIRSLATEDMIDLAVATGKLALWATTANEPFARGQIEKYDAVFEKFGIVLIPSYLASSAEEKNLSRIITHVANVQYAAAEIIEKGKYEISVPDEQPVAEEQPASAEVEA